MRTILLSSLLLLLSALVMAQQTSTNFPVGPQYLVTAPYGSVLQPIATPIISPSQATGMVSPQTGEAESVNLPSFPVPSNGGAVYWGASNPDVDVSQPPEPSVLPPGYFDTGVQGLATDESLHSEGYGVSVAQAASYWKQHKRPATHVYTNEDLQRLPRS